jgi:antitoxin FitA
MGDLTIRNLDDVLVRRLETRAAANGRSLDEEIRLALERVDWEEAAAGAAESEELRQARIARIRALGRPSKEPFDLKAFSDALSDGTE